MDSSVSLVTSRTEEARPAQLFCDVNVIRKRLPWTYGSASVGGPRKGSIQRAIMAQWAKLHDLNPATSRRVVSRTSTSAFRHTWTTRTKANHSPSSGKSDATGRFLASGQGSSTFLVRRFDGDAPPAAHRHVRLGTARSFSTGGRPASVWCLSLHWLFHGPCSPISRLTRHNQGHQKTPPWRFWRRIRKTTADVIVAARGWTWAEFVTARWSPQPAVPGADGDIDSVDLALAASWIFRGGKSGGLAVLGSR